MNMMSTPPAAPPLDQEARIDRAMGALDALISLTEAQVPGLAMPSDEISPLLGLVRDAFHDLFPADPVPHGLAHND